jgi:hypothetical protein
VRAFFLLLLLLFLLLLVVAVVAEVFCYTSSLVSLPLPPPLTFLARRTGATAEEAENEDIDLCDKGERPNEKAVAGVGGGSGEGRNRVVARAIQFRRRLSTHEVNEAGKRIHTMTMTNPSVSQSVLRSSLP